MKTIITIIMITGMMIYAAGMLADQEKTTLETTEAQLVRRADRPHNINEDYYVTYNWAERPKIGTNILIVKLFNTNGDQVQDLEISAVNFMPDSGCCPPSGEVYLHLNGNGDYLVPISFTMLGEWEIILSFWQEEEFVTNAHIKHNLR